MFFVKLLLKSTCHTNNHLFNAANYNVGSTFDRIEV